MRSPSLLLLTVAVGLAAEPAAAQYRDNQVLHKSYEQADFFYRSTWLNPFGLGSFGSAAAGFLRDPLVDLQLGPSRVGADSSGRDLVYVDLRSTSEKRSHTVYPMYRGIDMVADAAYFIPYPYYYRESRRPAEPAISAAAFARPLPVSLPSLTVGLTYEAIVDDQDYYAVPQDIYRSTVGTDFSGARVTDESIPITDVYGGEDRMHTTGHFPTLYAGVDLDNGWRVGARAAFAVFDRSGAVGSTYLDTYRQNGYESMNSHLEERDQRYVHRDLSIGLERSVAGMLFGGSVGYLDGTGRQNLARTDTSTYSWGDPFAPTDPNGSRYRHGGATTSHWEEDGGTTHGSLFFRHRSGSGRLFTATYRVERQAVDITVSSAARDSSYSIHRSTDGTNMWYHNHSSRLLDTRTGGGERTGTRHRAGLAMEWPVADRSSLTIGAVLTIDRRTTETSEQVDAYRSRAYHYEYTGSVDHHSELIVENKVLEWTLYTRRSAVRVPVLFRHRFSDRIELLAGITREMAEWRIEDETLARIAERITTVNGQTDIRAGFGERYREPVEQRTDVDTDVILGVTVNPVERFDVRLLVMPSRHDNPYGETLRTYRWWLGLTYRP